MAAFCGCHYQRARLHLLTTLPPGLIFYSQTGRLTASRLNFYDDSGMTMTPLVYLKGQCHEIFCFWFFSLTSFPQASDYTFRAVSSFFETSRRYSQLKVCHRYQGHRWQIEKTFKQKNFNNFVWTPLGSRVNKYINFCLQVHFKVSAA